MFVTSLSQSSGSSRQSIVYLFHKPNRKAVLSWPLVVGTTVWVANLLLARTLTLVICILSRNDALWCPFLHTVSCIGSICFLVGFLCAVLWYDGFCLPQILFFCAFKAWELIAIHCIRFRTLISLCSLAI